MKKMLFSISVLIAWAISLSAQVTQEQADTMVLEYIQKEVARPYVLYVHIHALSEEGIVLTTHKEETFQAKYACFVYFLNEYPDLNGPAQRRYLFVKEDNGSLLEVITSNDFGPGDYASWKILKASSGLVEPKENSDKFFYPNPMGDLLTVPCNGDQVRVEIYDLKGTRFFSGLLSEENACQLNVSFLSAGVYVVNVSGETYKIIKK